MSGHHPDPEAALDALHAQIEVMMEDARGEWPDVSEDDIYNEMVHSALLDVADEEIRREIYRTTGVQPRWPAPSTKLTGS